MNTQEKLQRLERRVAVTREHYELAVAEAHKAEHHRLNVRKNYSIALVNSARFRARLARQSS